MNNKVSLLIFSAVAIISISCNSQNTKDFDYGHVEGDKYINSFFDFEMDIPKGWVVQTKERMDNLTNSGKDLIAGDNENLKAIIKASEVNSANLLQVFQYEPGSPVDYNPSIMLVAENIKNAPGVKSGSDYLFHARKILAQSQVKYDHIDTEFKKEVINGSDIYTMNAEINLNGINIRQIYYSTIRKGFSFITIVSYVTNQQKKDLMKTVNSMQFKNN